MTQYVGSFAVRSGTGSQAITGVGFLPKVLIFFSASTSAGPDNFAIHFGGVADGSTSHGFAIESADNRSDKPTSSVSADNACLLRVNSTSLSGGDVLLRAHVTSLDADGFTIDVTVNTLSQGEVVGFLALAGDDLQYSIQKVGGSAVGDQTISGLDFAPTALFCFLRGIDGTPAGGVSYGGMPAYTAVTGVGGGGFCGDDKPKGSGNSECWRAQSATVPFAHLQAGAGTIESYASGCTLTSDGFVIHWIAHAPPFSNWTVLALGGIQATSGAMTQPTAPGTQTIATPGIVPKALILGSAGAVASGSVGTGFSLSLGAADADGHQHATWVGVKNGVDPSVTAKATSTTLAIGMAEPAAVAASSTITGEATATLGDESFDLEWTTADGTEREVLYLVLGEAPAPPDLPVYEDPCAIKTPLVFSIIKVPIHWTDGVADDWAYFRVAHTSLRDPATRFGGFKSPRYLTWGPIVHQASDWLSGQWQAATMALTLADTDHALRAFLDTLPASPAGRQPGSLRGSQIAHYLTGNTHRLADGDPRVLNVGQIKSDTLDAHLVYGANAADPIGFGYNVLARETMIPQRDLESDFPGFGLTGVMTPTIGVLGATIIAGTHSDELKTEGDPPHTGFGRLPQLYCGTLTGLDANDYHIGLVAGHACHELIEVRDQNGLAVTWGTNAFGPGKTGWASVNPSGAALYTVINGRTYTVCLYPVGDALGDGFATGSNQLFSNVTGLTRNGDGSGGPVTNFHDQLLLAITNFFLPGIAWETGAWLEIPDFEWAPGRFIPLIDAASIATVKAIVDASYLPGGMIGTWAIGLGGQQQELSSLLAQFFVQAHVSMARNRYLQYFFGIFNPNPDGLRTVTDARDTLKSLPLTAAYQDALLTNNLRGAWGFNPRLGTYDLLGQVGDSPSFQSFGNNVAEPELYTLIGPEDVDTAAATGLARLAFRAAIRRPVTWREGLCGLRHQVLDVVLMRHYNGLGPAGYQDRALWIRKQTFNQDGTVDYEAYDVQDLMYSAEAPGGGLFLRLEVTGTPPGVGYSTYFEAIAHYSDDTERDVTRVATWSSSAPGVATVDAATGLVTGVGAGTTTITAVFEKTAIATLAIEIVSITQIAVRVEGLSPSVGGTRQLRAFAVFDDGSEIDVTSIATWTSLDPSSISVDAAGVVTGVVGAIETEIDADYP